MSQKTFNLCLERYNFVKFGETTKSSHTVLCTNNAYSVNSDNYRLTPTAIASKHGEGYVFTLNYDFDRPLFTIVQKSYTLDGTSGNIVFEGIDPISKAGSKYLRRVEVSPVKLSDGSYLLEVTNDEYLRIGTTGAALGDEDLQSLNEKIVTDGGITKSVETVGGRQVLKLDAGGPSGAKEIVYFDVDPSDPPSGIYEAIGEALANNKEPVIKNDGAVYFYTSTGTDKYIFVGGYNTEVVNYKTVTVSDDDSVVMETVDTIEGMVFPLYYHSNDGGFTVADKTGHALTKTEIADAYRAGQIFMFSSYPASNTQAHWGYCCDINIESDNTGYAEFLILDAFGGDVYSWEKYKIILLSNTEFVTLEGPNTSYTTGGSGRFADAATTVSVSDSQDFSATQKAQGRDNIGAASASDVTALQSQVSSLSNVSAYSVKGEATVAQLNAGPSGIQAGWAYQLTDSGTLTDGSLAVVAGDTVAWDGTKWFPLVKSDYYASKTYAQNVAHSIAPEFDPTRTIENPYKAGELVTYTNGKSYKFKVDHYGPWNAADVEYFVAGEILKFMVVSDNPEYLYAVTDKNGAFIFGVKKEGGIEWAVGVPLPVRRYVASKVDKETGKSLINSIFADGVSVIGNPEYIATITDFSGNILFGFRKDGDVVFGYGVPAAIKAYVNKIAGGKVDKETGKSLINSTFAAGVSIVQNPEYLKTIVDALNKVIIGVKEDGSVVFKAPVSFDNIKWSQNNLYQLGTALKELGLIRGVGDQSEKSSLHIPMPKFCVINFSNILRMPLTKTEDAKAIMEFWDNSGNYFKKNVIANAQGNSSLVFVKKNVSFDLCNDDWVGDDTFKIKFGEWVEQDSFHLKAYYTDFFRGLAIPAYNFYKEILDTHGNDSDRTWKLALNIDPNNYGQGLGYGESSSVHDRLDNGALCFPQGFPALVYLNGEFYGIFSWNLKKHRDNYHMDKSNKNHIHLDGIIGADFFSGNIDWTDFEVRNPKKLICMDGSDYDGDNPTELIDSSSGAYNPNNSKHVFTASVKEKIVALSGRLAEISAAATTEDKKTLFEKYFCSGNLIDYQIFSDVLRNTDGFNKNWQWTTWDGERWFVNAYDLDETFGSHNTGIVIFEPLTTRLGQSESLPSGVMQALFGDELEARYAELRSAGIVDSKKLADKISSWCKTIGEKFYKLEFEKWDDSPCNRGMVVAEGWEVVLGDDGKPLITYSHPNEYNPSRTYTLGEVVNFNATTVKWWYNFRCTSASLQGVQPIERFGQRDNLWRVENWLRISIANMDGVYNYNN